MKNTKLDASFRSATRWQEEADRLREILLATGLKEEIKWGKPCYVFDGNNIAIIQRMKDFLALLFFKGALLKDPDGILERQGPNSREGFRARFTSLQDVLNQEQSLKACILEAIEVEKAGLTIEKPKPADLQLPEELQIAFARDPEFRTAFNDLTPGRQRGYCLYFSDAKQSGTRTARIEKYRQKILSGKGFHDR